MKSSASDVTRVFRVSFISQGVFYPFGQPIAENVIRPFMLAYEAKPEQDDELAPRQRELNFRLHEPYFVDQEGNRISDRRLARQAADMSAIAQEQEWIEQQMERGKRMTSYTLVQKSANQLKATFHIVNASGDIVGSVNVPPNHVSHLLRHWNGPTDGGEHQRQLSQLLPGQKFQTANATLRNRPPIGRMSQRSILRGC